MSLRTVWLRRIESVLKSHSVIAVRGHWLIYEYAVHYRDGDARRFSGGNNGIPACEIRAMHLPSTVTVVDVVATQWETEFGRFALGVVANNVLCATCFKLCRKFVEAHGYAAFRRGTTVVL